MNYTSFQTNIASLFQWIYHTDTKNSLHKAQSILWFVVMFFKV